MCVLYTTSVCVVCLGLLVKQTARMVCYRAPRAESVINVIESVAPKTAGAFWARVEPKRENI